MKRILPIFVFLACASCRDTRVEDPVPVGSEDRIYEDVPIFQGMKYDERGKMSHDGTWRLSQISMRGTAHVKDVVEFYRKALPVHHWQLQNEQGAAPEPVTLVYTKGKERLTLEVRRESVHETLATVNIAPK